MLQNKIHIFGGGTFSHVRNHLAIAAPAFGETARQLKREFDMAVFEELRLTTGLTADDIEQSIMERVALHLTKMADPQFSKMVTNEDVAFEIRRLLERADTRVIILNAALCDYDGHIIDATQDEIVTPSGSHELRLKTAAGRQEMHLFPASKIISTIRKERKDVFVVGFKTTTGATPDEQYLAGLNMLKASGINLVVANDTVTRNNMIITPEESRYCDGEPRAKVLQFLVKMVMSRTKNTFTRSTVVDGAMLPWAAAPDSLKKVVDHCIERGAYKPFRGATVGHFAYRGAYDTIVTSPRKRNFNELDKIGMVMIEPHNDGGADAVLAYGAKPSVGGQSQRIIFSDHPDMDCIVHFHCPMKAETPTNDIDCMPIADQWPNECGSHECGKNTSDHLAPMRKNERGTVKAVFLDNHGPNIVFSRDTDPQMVIDFIEENFDLTQKTGGMVA